MLASRQRRPMWMVLIESSGRDGLKTDLELGAREGTEREGNRATLGPHGRNGLAHMALGSRDDIERVRDATDLVELIGEHVALSPRGREHVGLCPFHDDRRPSFAVVTHKAAAFYKCHACGAAGDCFRFVQEFLGKDFGESLRFLAERAGIELTATTSDGQSDRQSRRTWLRSACEQAHTHFRSVLDDPERGREARKMIEHRGINAEMTKAFGIGAAGEGWRTLLDAISGTQMPEKVLAAAGLIKQREDGHAWDTFRHRLMFPICDETGRPIAFGGRVLSDADEPKYLNSSEHDLFHKGRTLYGLHLARRSIMQTGTAIIAEGYTDVIACHQAGIEHVVATLGTAMTEHHARTLSRLCNTCILLFDGDEAGQRAATRAIPIMISHDVDVRICVLPGGSDPDTLLREPDGRAQFDAAIENALDAFAFLLNRLETSLADMSSLSGRQRAIEAFIQDLSRHDFGRAEPLRRAMLISRLAELAGVAPTVISDQISQAQPTPPSERTPEEPAPESFDFEDDQHIAPAMRQAELDTLAISIYLGKPCPAHDWLTTDARRIAQALREACQQSGTPGVQNIMDQLDGEDARILASDLYFQGQQLVEAADSAQAALDHARDAMTRCQRQLESRQRLTEWKSNAADDPKAAAAIIEHLRGLGPRAAAMPRPTNRGY